MLFNDKEVVAPVHICSLDSKVESYLIGTNAVMPLGLMVPSMEVRSHKYPTVIKLQTHRQQQWYT